MMIGTKGLELPLGQFNPVEDGHRPIGDYDIGIVAGEGFKARGPVLRFIDFARSEPVQQLAHDPAHMGIIVDDKESQAMKIEPDHCRAWVGRIRGPNRPI
jgi:hypothetical protein